MVRIASTNPILDYAAGNARCRMLLGQIAECLLYNREVAAGDPYKEMYIWDVGRVAEMLQWLLDHQFEGVVDVIAVVGVPN